MAAGLVFRVGQADETLARRGVTHLLGHLAIYSVGMVDYHHYMQTGPLITKFHTQGSESDVVTFLHAVCEALYELPLNRLDSERKIVKTEDASTPSSVDEYLAGLRYGARGHGLAAYPELGVHSIAPDELTAWAARYFTRGNAALWPDSCHFSLDRAGV
jgi:zinc protease